MFSYQQLKNTHYIDIYLFIITMHSDDIATHLMCRSFKDIEPITSDYSD